VVGLLLLLIAILLLLLLLIAILLLLLWLLLWLKPWLLVVLLRRSVRLVLSRLGLAPLLELRRMVLRILDGAVEAGHLLPVGPALVAVALPVLGLLGRSVGARRARCWRVLRLTVVSALVLGNRRRGALRWVATVPARIVLRRVLVVLLLRLARVRRARKHPPDNVVYRVGGVDDAHSPQPLAAWSPAPAASTAAHNDPLRGLGRRCTSTDDSSRRSAADLLEFEQSAHVIESLALALNGELLVGIREFARIVLVRGLPRAAQHGEKAEAGCW